jgi:hypothetical protein
MRLFLREAAAAKQLPSGVQVFAQRYESGRGITDIELLAGRELHVIAEAKRGWALPDLVQLRKYARRLRRSRAATKALLTISECTPHHANHILPRGLLGIPVRHLPWARIEAMVREAIRGSSRQERWLLFDLSRYLAETTGGHVKDSNLVYVAALSRRKFEGTGVTWTDIVTRRGVYFCPTWAPYPQEPPTYIGFRYDGQLQSIHFVKGVRMIRNYREAWSELPDREEDYDLALYRLGPPIKPSKPVKTGTMFRASPAWAAIDLLLTCKTISDARDETRRRAARLARRRGD